MIQFCSGFFCGFTDKTFSLTSTSHYSVALNLFCRLSGRWTLFMNFVILIISLIVASYNDAFTAEKLETTTSHGAQTVVATSNRTIHLGCQGSSQSAGKLEEPSFARSWILVSNSTTDRSNVGATLEVCTMQEDGKGQRSLLSKLWPALDGMCGWPCISSPCSARGLGLGCHTTTHRNSAAENEKQICRASSRWWLEAERQRSRQTTAWQQPGRQSIGERQRRSQRSRKVVGWTNWIGCSIALCNLPGLATPHTVGAGGIGQCGNNNCLGELLQCQQRAAGCCCQSISGQKPDARGAARLGGKGQLAVLQVHHKGLAFCHEQSWQIQETASGGCGSEEGSQTSLDPPSHGIPRALAKAVTRFHTTTSDAGRKRKQSDPRHTTGQQEHTESQPAGRRHGRTNERVVNIGTSSPGQSRSLHAEGQRDDRSAKETPKVLWRMHGCYWPQGSKGPCRGDCGFRRRRGQETEKTEVFGSQRWCFVIHGRALLCQKSNRKHAGRVQFDPLVEAYGDTLSLVNL